MKGEVRCLVCGKGYLKPAEVEESQAGGFFFPPREKTASWWKPKRVAAAQRKLDQGIGPAQNDRLGSLGCNGIRAHR